MSRWLEASRNESARLVGELRELVACESPSHDAVSLDACAAIYRRHLEGSGARVERRGVPGAPPHILATWPGGGPRVLLLGHFDTVWARGQILRQPLEERDGRLFGPGVYDMKAGLAVMAAAMRILISNVGVDRLPAVTLLATSDEEVGSASSRGLIEQLARESRAVLVFEPALAGGAVKTSRKGVGEFEITATGIASHAGVDPGAGASAVHEIARQVLAAQALSDPARGVSVNVGVIEGGTRGNVVAERARAVVDVRVTTMADAARIEAALHAFRATDGRVTVSVTGAVNRPPMERGPGVARLYALAQSVARGLGWELAEGATGGASDGNFSAALGVPTLDGLGAIGDGAHALHEHVIIKDLAPRVALAAAMLSRIGDNDW